MGWALSFLATNPPMEAKSKTKITSKKVGSGIILSLRKVREKSNRGTISPLPIYFEMSPENYHYLSPPILLRPHEIDQLQEQLFHRYDSKFSLEEDYGKETEQKVQDVIGTILANPNILIKITETDGYFCSLSCKVRSLLPHHCEGDEMVRHEREEAKTWGVKIGQVIAAKDLFKLPD